MCKCEQLLVHGDRKDIQDKTNLDKRVTPTVNLKLQINYDNVSRMNGDIKGMQLTKIHDIFHRKGVL